MRRLVATVLVLLLSGSQAVRAAEHVVQPREVAERLGEAARARANDLASVEAALSMPEAQKVATRLGVDIARVRQAVPLLSDAELHDVAMRSTLLGKDPVSGSSTVPEFPTWFVVLVLVVIIALIVALGFRVKALASID
jgi:hypothetical protein